MTDDQQAVRRYDSMGFESEFGLWIRFVDHDATVADLARANSNNTALYSALERVTEERDKLAARLAEAEGREKRLREALLDFLVYFKSGNQVPVERAVIRADSMAVIRGNELIAALSTEEKP